MTNANNFELNKGDNFIFGLDVSGSMATTDTPSGASRIDYSKEKAIAFAKSASQYDADGIDLITFGHQVKEYLNVTAENAETIIGGLKANEGQTHTHELIKAAYARHKALAAEDQTVLFIVTDGAPSDKDAVKKAIIDITNDVSDEHEFNICFLTVGKIDDNLKKFLNGLDDDLQGAKYDIVDVKALEDVDFMTAFMGALND